MYKDGKLTILIPTFNREKQLLELLGSLQNQGHIGEYYILICDNHSEYDVENAIENHLDKEFLSNINIHKWAFNTGMATNISVPFLLVDTEWCWVISDDDFLTAGALDHVLTEIETFKDVLAIKNSLVGYLQHDDRYISSVEEFADYYDNDQRNGEMMYLSMIYNMKNLYPYFSRITEYSYSNLSFLLPIIFGLSKGGRVRFESFQTINYRDNAEDNWTKKRALKVALGIKTLMDIDFGVDKETHKKILKVLLRNVRSLFCLTSLLNHSSWYYRSVVWSSLQPMFKLNTSWHKRILCNAIFYLYQYTNINMASYLVKKL